MKLIENIAIKHRYIESNVNFSNMTIEVCNDIVGRHLNYTQITK